MRKNFKYEMSTVKFVLMFVFALSVFELKPLSQEVRIGVLLPLFENSEDVSKKQLGIDLSNGILFAMNEYNRNPGTKVTLDIRDTERDPKICSEKFNEMAQNKGIIGVLGPIFSSELAEITGFALTEMLPLISPTATGDNLAENHDYVFQLNPSYKVRGKLIANYMMKQMKMENFAVISEDTYGVNFKTHFEDEVRKLGGNIVSSHLYSKSATSIAGIIDSLLNVIKENDLFININNLNLQQRQKIESSGVRPSLIDSLVSMNIDVSVYYLFGRYARKIIDTMNIKPYKLKSTNSKYIQGYIDAIYIPISNTNEIGIIVPALSSNGLEYFIAGTGDWNNDKALEDNKVYLKNLIMESEYFVDEKDSRVQSLKERLKKTKFKFNKSFLFGYDAMSIILSLISEGNTTRQKLNESLMKLSNFEGIKSKFSLDYYRINSELNILSYENGLNLIQTYKINR